MKQKLIHRFFKYRLFALGALIFMMLAYTLWSLQPISNPGVDPAYLNQLEGQQVTKLNVDSSLKKRLESLTPTQINVRSTPSGNKDPFNP